MRRIFIYENKTFKYKVLELNELSDEGKLSKLSELKWWNKMSLN